MALLESAMAFAVVMIILSTVATGIVEVFIRIVRRRGLYLMHAIERLFDDVAWPNFATKGQAGAEKNRLEENFVEGMLGNPTAYPYVVSQWELPHRLGDLLRGIPLIKLLIPKRRKLATKIEALTPLAFAERLGRTEIGHTMFKQGEGIYNVLVPDLVRSFDRYSRTAAEVFRRNAQFLTVLVGIALALAVNVDAGRIMTALIESPELRNDFIEQANEAFEENEAATKKLAALIPLNDNEPTTEDESDTTDAVGETDPKKLEEVLDELEASLTKLDSLRERDLPIGWSYYPHCLISADKPENCDKENDSLVRWFLMTLLAGFLIGLGGPFWYRVFTSLSQLFQLLKAVGFGKGGSKADPETYQAKNEDAENSAKPDDILDAFETAATAHAKALEAKRP